VTSWDLAATFRAKGASVARKRPTASDVSLSLTDAGASDRAGLAAEPDPDPGALTPAQTRALRRCAPLNSSEFEAQRLVVAQPPVLGQAQPAPTA